MSIKHLAGRRPSPALIVACCALFVALGGTSYAVAVGSIGSPQIRDGSIRGIDVQNRALSGNDLRADSVGGGAIKEETLDVSKLDLPQANPLAAEGLALQVMVASDGGSFHRRGVTSVDHPFTGRYEITFDRDPSGCVYAATLTIRGAADGSQTGHIAVGPGWHDGSLLVVTEDLAGVPADRPFHLMLSC